MSLVSFDFHTQGIRRIGVQKRPNWKKDCEDCGLSFHSPAGGYWEEGARYAVPSALVDSLVHATAELYELCMRATAYVFEHEHAHAPLYKPQNEMDKITV
jgi:glutathionylspermidine synthase